MHWLGLAVLISLTGGPASAQRVGAPTDDLTRVGVDELFGLEVTSVGRKAQEMSKAPAAVFVLTAEDIRRSGAVSLPQLLQVVPGLTSLSSDDRSWIVSARGSARLYSNKILVLIDGRSLYTPLFSGVIWDTVDVPLGDIERIEIVRGAAAVMWGPHAVNGVINIITKKARQTKGVRTSALTGNALPGSAETRWGDSSGDRLAYRIWGKLDYQTPGYGSQGLYYLDTFSTVDPSIRNLDAAGGRMGFRLDFEPGEASQLMVQGDMYKRDRQDALGIPAIQPNLTRSQEHADNSGGYLQAKWTLASASGAETEVQFTYDKTQLGYPYLHGDLNNVTFDFQRRIQTGARNEVYWGAGYQRYWDQTVSNRYVAFNPADSVIQAADIVLRDEWQILPGKLTGSAGIRLDHSSFSRFDYQPSLRLLFAPDGRHSAWLAASRAVRTPDRFDRGLQADNGTVLLGTLPVHQSLAGSPDFYSEVERSVEAGYRMQTGQRWSLDASVFLSRYEGLRAASISEPAVIREDGGFHLDMAAQMMNGGHGRSFGGELWGTVQIRPGWRLMPSYSYVHDERWLNPSTFLHQMGWDREPSDLRHQGVLRSRHDLSRQWKFDWTVRVRDRDRTFGLPGAMLLDARIAWQASRSTELGLTCRNLTDRRVFEGIAEGPEPSIPLRRILLLQWTQKF